MLKHDYIFSILFYSFIDISLNGLAKKVLSSCTYFFYENGTYHLAL